MKKELFENPDYRLELENVVGDIEYVSEFPFEDYFLTGKYLSNKENKNAYNIIKDTKLLYFIEDNFYGVITLDGNDYMIKINDEIMINIIGDTESNWIELIVDFDLLTDFQSFCSQRFGIKEKLNDYDHLLEIENRFLFPKSGYKSK